MTRKASSNLLALLLVALTTVAVGSSSSASAALPAETRVGAFNIAGEVLVEPHNKKAQVSG